MNTFENNQFLKSQDYTNPPPRPTNFESLPYPPEGVGLNFFAKMRGKDELKGTWSNFTPWLRVFGHQGENYLGELGLKVQLFGYKGLV